MPVSCDACGKKLECVGCTGEKPIGGAVAPCPLKKGAVWVHVQDDRGVDVSEEMKVTVSGEKTTAAGFASWDPLVSGPYTATLATPFTGTAADKYAPPEQVTVPANVTDGNITYVAFKLPIKNVVTPKIEMEYKVVLMDRDLGDDKRKPEPTYIEVSFEETNPAYPFKDGAEFKCVPADLVEVYLDKDCKKKVTGDLKDPDFGPGKKTKLYLKGLKKGGKFKAILTLKAPTDPKVKLGDKNPAEEEMGVVEIVLEMHQHDKTGLEGLEVDPASSATVAAYHTALKDKAIPDQKALTDEQKTKEGRLLHEQKSGHFGRAKARMKKLTADQWPAGTDAYKIVIKETAASGGLAIFDKEDEGSAIDPPEFTVADLKAAEKIVWVEGKSAVKKKNDVVLDLALDRAEGGLAKDVKRFGDWAAFTVVKIKEVKFEISNDAGKAVVYDSGKKRFYINTDDDPAGREWKDKPAKGKKIKVTAELTEKIAKVPIHFLLSNNKDNYTKAHWGSDLPAAFDWIKLDEALRAKDKASGKKVLHLSAETDADGLAKMEQLSVSRFGGDKFKLGAYVTQDPHLAKFTQGHADLSKREPVLGADEFQIWRRVWVQLSVNKDSAMAARAPSVTSFENAFVEYKEVDEKKFDKTTIAGLVEHPQWQFRVGGTEDKVICVGDHNKTKFHGLMMAEKAETKPKCHLVMCDFQWDPIVGPKVGWDVQAADPQLVYKNATGDSYLGIFDPPLKGAAMLDTSVDPKWQWTDTAGKNHAGKFTAADLYVEKARTHTTYFKIKTPTACPPTCGCGTPGTAIAPSATNKLQIRNIQINAATGPWAGESGSAASPHCLIVINPDSNQFNNTITHEVGHLFDQVRTATGYSGLPDHPDQYVKRGGQGSHCKKSATEHATAVDQDGAKQYTGGTCTMYHVAVGNTEFCHNCRADLRVRDLSGFGK